MGADLKAALDGLSDAVDRRVARHEEMAQALSECARALGFAAEDLERLGAKESARSCRSRAAVARALLSIDAATGGA